MSIIDLKLKSYDELIFEITTLNTNNYLLQQKVEQLEERCEYLERSNNRREDEIIELRNENVDLVSKNNQLENIRKEAIEFIKKYQRKDEFLNLNEWQSRDLLNILNKGSEE